MKPAEQLEWEARNGPKAAAAAFAAGFFVFASFAIQAVTFGGASGDQGVLLRIHDQQTAVLLGRASEAISTFLTVLALYFLLRRILARRPEGLRFLLPVLVLAPLLLLVAGIVGYIDATDAAQRFASGAHTKARAKDLVGDLRGPVTLAAGQAGALCLGLSYVLSGVNGMRSGLLSRFMGILGIVSGALIVLPVLPAGIIQLFWLVALGLLFLGRWPNGRGPAWSKVEAIRWPTAAETRDLATAGPERHPDPPVVPETNGAGEKPAQRRSSRKKKKRKP